MTRARHLAAVAVLLGAACAAQRGLAQIVYGDDPTGKLRFIVTSWTTGDPDGITLSQTLVPFFGYVPLGENTEGRIYLARGWNSLEAGAGNSHLDGMTDARLQVNRSFAEDRFLVSIGASLPTGRTGLDLDGDLRVMSVLAHDYLIYPNRRLGEGLGLNGMLGAALSLGAYRAGGSVSVHYSGSYEAFAGQGDYRPGHYVRGYAGIQRPAGPFDFMTGVSVTAYGNDSISGHDIYNRGDQWEFHLGGQYRQPGFFAALSARTFLRGRSRVYDLSGTEPNQVQLYGDELAVSASCSWFLRGRTLEVGPLADLRLIGGNELGLGRARNLGLGLQSFLQVAGKLRLGLSYQTFTGEADAGAIDLSGHQVASSVSGTF